MRMLFVPASADAILKRKSTTLCAALKCDCCIYHSVLKLSISLYVQVALKAMQKHHRNAALHTADNAEVARLQGALQQSREDYQHLLEQFSQYKAGSAAANSSSQHLRQHMSDLQTANAALKSQLHHSQQQLQRHTQEADKAQKLLEQLSKAAADVHAVTEAQQVPTALPSASRGFSARHNLQAVHDAVQHRMDRYDSTEHRSGQLEDDSNELILPALWRPQKERYLAPTGFR